MLTFNVVWRPFRLVYVAVLAAAIYWVTDYQWLPSLICMASYIDFDLDLFNK